jgi:hypothetical protein
VGRRGEYDVVHTSGRSQCINFPCNLPACLALRFLFPRDLLARVLRRFRAYIRSQRKGALLLRRDGVFWLRLCEHLNAPGVLIERV